MSIKYFSNRRMTFRDRISIMGKIILTIKDKIYTESIEIEDITYEGIKIVISDNDFLFKYLELYEENAGEITIQFEYEKIRYEFKNIINWFRVYDMGERNYYILSSLKYKDRYLYKDILVDLIASIQMEKFYIAN